MLFSGDIGLDKSLNMIVTLPYTITGDRVTTEDQASGARIKLPLTGTIDKPEIDTGRLLETQLRQELEKQIRRGLEDLFK